MIEEENGALLSFDHYEASSTDRGENHAEKVLEEEPEAPRVTVRDDEEHDLEDHDMAEPQRPVDPPKEVSHKRKLAWARELIRDTERYGAPEGSLRDNNRPRTYSSYVVLLSNIIYSEPSSFEEVVGKQVWKDAMHEEY